MATLIKSDIGCVWHKKGGSSEKRIRIRRNNLAMLILRAETWGKHINRSLLTSLLFYFILNH